MFDPYRVRKWSESFLSSSLLAVVAVLALVVGLSAQSQELSSLDRLPDLKSAKGGGEPIAMTPRPAVAGLPDSLSPALRASAASLMSAG